MQDRDVTLHQAVAGLLVRAHHVAVRPSGKALYLNRTSYVMELGKAPNTYGRLSVSDVLAEDWEIVTHADYDRAVSLEDG